MYKKKLKELLIYYNSGMSLDNLVDLFQIDMHTIIKIVYIYKIGRKELLC